MQTLDAVQTLVVRGFGDRKVEVTVGSKVPKTINLRGPVDTDVVGEVLVLTPSCEQLVSSEVLVRVPAGTQILCENSQCVEVDNATELQF